MKAQSLGTKILGTGGRRANFLYECHLWWVIHALIASPTPVQIQRTNETQYI